MESTSSNSVNPTPGWSGGSRSNSAPAADPMAFFDLIMKSTQAMTKQGGKSFDLVASTASATVANDPYTAPTDDPNLHDGYDDSAPSYAGEVHAREASEANTSEDTAIAQDRTAAVAEFSEQQSAHEEKENEPDQAALETAASATQQDQLLGAPDTLAQAEQVEAAQQDPVDAIKSADEKENALLSGQVNTDQTLDTTKASEDSPNEQDDTAKQNGANTVQDESNGTEAPAFDAMEEEPVEAASETNSREEASDIRSPEDGKLKLDEVDTVKKETVDTDVSLDTGNTAQDDSSDRHPRRNASTPRAIDNNANQVDVVEPAATTSPDASTMAAVTKASEALAAAASSSAATTASSSGNATPNNTAGVNNLASLLQRGIQRGSLQKAEGSQSPQLDPKQQIRLINRVARAVETTPPGQSIKIRLNPSELGQLKVEIKIENGNMSAKIEAENATTRQVLLDNLPQLRERLAEANIHVQHFEVELMGQQTPQDGSASAFADQSERQDGSHSSHRKGAETNSEEESASSARETINKDAERESRNLNVTI